MKPIDFENMNSTAAENQPEYLPLPMYRNDSQIISCWQMSWRERFKALFTGKIWMRLMQPSNELITPSLLETDSPFGPGRLWGGAC